MTPVKQKEGLTGQAKAQKEAQTLFVFFSADHNMQKNIIFSPNHG
jgi:hypothetical protein